MRNEVDVVGADVRVYLVSDGHPADGHNAAGPGALTQDAGDDAASGPAAGLDRKGELSTPSLRHT